MKKQNVPLSKLVWPFKALGRSARKLAVGYVNLCKNDELQELSESLDRSMNQIAESLEKIKQSTMKFREYSETIAACKQATAYNCAGQNPENITNQLADKNKGPEGIGPEAKRGAYLRNRIWQNRQN